MVILAGVVGLAGNVVLEVVLDDELIAKHFSDCDANGNSWISFKEAETAMGLDRPGFAAFDEGAAGLAMRHILMC